MLEWNGMQNVIESYKRMHTWYHLSSSLKFLVCGAVSLGYCQGGWAQGIGALLCPGHELTAGIYNYFTPLGNYTAIKCWGVTYKLDHVEIYYHFESLFLSSSRYNFNDYYARINNTLQTDYAAQT